jgi:two-component sensor histidine kinase
VWRGWFNRVVNWRIRVPTGSAQAYFAATLLVIAASLVRWALGFLGPVLLPFTTYFPAVLFATYIGGLRVGIFAAILGGFIGWGAFMPSHFALSSVTHESEIELATYLIACVLIIWGADSYRRLADRLQDEEKLRKLAVDELAHRLKNKIASIQSIISFQLREQPQLMKKITGRLVALSATDDLIMATQGRGGSIRAILTTELEPYGLSRIAMEGPDIVLSPNLALTMALIVHELATNAAKYGALSSAVGKLSIWWSLTDRTLTLEWQESGGPLVAPPTHYGFGLQLLSRALEQFGGTAETIFEKNGLICRMKAVLPKSPPSIVPNDQSNYSAVA